MDMNIDGCGPPFLIGEGVEGIVLLLIPTEKQAETRVRINGGTYPPHCVPT